MQQIETNAIIRKMKKEDGEKPIMLEGYIEELDGLIRLHNDFHLQNYIEVPREAIIHVISASENAAKITRVLVKGSAKIRFVNTIKAGDLSSMPDLADEISTVFQQTGDGPIVGTPPVLAPPGGSVWECILKGVRKGVEAEKSCNLQGYSKSFCKEAAQGTALLTYQQCRSPRH